MRQEQAEVYVAMDGKKFLIKEECMEYERALQITYHFMIQICSIDIRLGKVILLSVSECKNVHEARLNAEYYAQLTIGDRIIVENKEHLRQHWTCKQVVLEEDKALLDAVQPLPNYEEIRITAFKGYD